MDEPTVSLEVRPSRSAPGVFTEAEIVGFEAARHAGDPGVQEMLRAVLAEFGVVCVRNPRKLEKEVFRAVAEMFGPIKDPVGRIRGGGEMRYDTEMQIIDSGFVLSDEMRQQLSGLSFGGLDTQRPGLFETFHVDDTYTELPAAATVLNARALPSAPGGDTCFLDMRAAYELLDGATKERLDGLRAVYEYNNGGAFPPRVAASGPNDALVAVTHPIVRRHPVTGRQALYIDLDRATHVAGMNVAEGRALLRELQEHAEARAPRWRHRWQPNDVLVWDNASVQHKASGDFPLGEPRRFHRFLLAGGRPV